MGELIDKRYIPLLKAITKHTNIVNSGMNDKIPLNEHDFITIQDWLVVELIVEQRAEYHSMVELSRIIGLPPTTFFRIVGHLKKVGLVEKYRVQNNKKNIVLRPTELALNMYSERTTDLRSDIWGAFFKELDHFSDDDIRTITNAFINLNEHLPSARYSQEPELIKID